MKKKILLIFCVLIMLFSACRSNEAKVTGKCSVSVECTILLDKLDKLIPEKKDIIPKDGIIISEREVEILEGENGLDIIRKTGAVVRSSDGYIQGINSIDERDCGNMSGWIYEINGEAVMESLGDYKPSDGDKIELIYYAE